ncbi:hypothetical protein GCM10027535_08590 [Mycolicibacterium hippocampi]|uniref:ATPase n=2 Tax=Mycolicibacterium hippocampi TaxID=659824 RepID=A0A7I9ZL31_9MYCO|nr:hypothetical protein MHIP_22180 [Mycolicibacterium hippocampi]
MRNTVNLGVALIALADPDTSARTTGEWLLAILAVWSLYRLLTRSRGIGWLGVDYLLVLAVCASIPVLVPDPGFHTSNTAPQAIAGTAVVSISVAVSPYRSILMTAGVAAAYAWGAAGVIGWENLSSVTALYYFAVQWVTASAIRFILLRMAGVIDRARAERHRAELNRRIVDAVRDYEYEQLALLHDTAASTLLVVGQDIPVSAERLAAQARRDLDLLDNGAWVTPPLEVELVASLRECAAHISTPVRFSGRDSVWLPGESAHPVIAAAREAMTNVDRHARASGLHVVVTDSLVRIEDDGVGFDAHAPQAGHGLNDSIIGRMRRSGGHARVTSTPGAGTVTELCWAATPAGLPATSAVNEPDPLVERTRARYALALTTFALVNLLITVPPAVTSAAEPGLNTVLGILAALSTLAAIPGILYGRWRYAAPAGITLLVVAAVQPALLPAELVVGYAHWAQSTIGWCVLPLVLRRPTHTGAAILTGYWLVGSAVTLIREPSAAALLNIGLGTASILAVQLFALIFNGLMRDAAADAHVEIQAHQRLLTRDRVSRALQAEYRRRYAKVVDNVVPLLDALARGHEVDPEMQLRARTECRRLRVLFDQAAAFDHPLMQEIRTLIDLAESRQVEVVVDLGGTIGDLGTDQIASLVTPLGDVLQHANSYARVVVTTSGGLIELSIVCDVTSDLAKLRRRLGHTELVVAGNEIWCLVRISGRTPTPPR